MKSIAILFTCYNRIHFTKNCLNAIERQYQELKDIYTFSVFVCNDGSTDGTEKIFDQYSFDIEVINSGGNLYWSKGMYMAMLEGTRKHHDFYLMINDDVRFYEDAIKIMIDAYYEAGRSCGITGATRSVETSKTTYGGKLLGRKDFLVPSGELQICDLANWNCFLVDNKVVEEIGIIDPAYAHSYGDWDYSLRMKRKGFHIFLAKEYIGECNRNSVVGTFKDLALSKKKRLKNFFSPKGMPFKSGFRYAVRNMDYLHITYLLAFLGAYIKNLTMVIFH